MHYIFKKQTFKKLTEKNQQVILSASISHKTRHA